MADVASLMARLRQGQPSTVRFVDPVIREMRDVAVDPAFAGRCSRDTVFVPLRENVGSRLQRAMPLTDEARVVVDQVLGDMIAECAVSPVGDDVLQLVLGHLADLGFTIVKEAR